MTDARSASCRSTPATTSRSSMVSFDPRETPELAAAEEGRVPRALRPAGAGADGWHFLTGEPPSIERLTQAAGFRYAWDEETQQFAHPAGIVVLTPDGRLARYLFGLEYGAARPAAGAGRGVGGPDRLRRRRAAALLLSLRPDDRPLRSRRDATRCAWPAPRPSLALGTFIVVMVRASARASGATHPAAGTRLRRP